MGYHHLALATRDIKATHEFYTAAMGFTLVKVAVGPAGKTGFAKHLFYDTGDGPADRVLGSARPELPPDWSPAIATGLGLPPWTNHVAFAAADRADIDRRRERWLAHGADVMEVDHGWCLSVYTTDPNGILVEFCTTTDAGSSITPRPSGCSPIRRRRSTRSRRRACSGRADSSELSGAGAREDRVDLASSSGGSRSPTP
jgi:catechol 2,3-dioxygenase-like lactoylglutathione lyase family enzyme